MKFLLSALLATVAMARPSQVKMDRGISVESKVGQNLMSHARRVEENNQNNAQYADEEVDFTWVANYSIKFQGCHHISQWNEEANGEEDVRVMTKRLVRFRLCPTEICTAENGGGCDEGYGEYIVDMNIFLAAYMESVQDYYEVVCQNLEEGECACNNANNQEGCQYKCFEEHGVEDWCADGDPYDYNEENVRFELEEYMECAQWNPQGRRRLDQNEIEYFVGPYCSDQGGVIHLGVFTDETCSSFADDYAGLETWKKYSGGEELPYSKNSEKSIIDMDCISCKEPDENDGYNNGGNDYQDEDEVRNVCEEIYRSAGKCESYGLSNIVRYPNDNACSYMEGIQVVRLDGTLDESKAGGANKTASIFIGIFVVAFVLLGAYVYYLKTKLDRASINLAE